MEDYVTFEQSQKLKDLGFNWDCWTFYYTKLSDERVHTNEWFTDHNGCGLIDTTSAPTLSQVQKWLFERHGYFLSVQYNSESENFQCVIYKQTFTQGYYSTNESYVEQIFQGSENLRSYEPTRCLSKGITKVLELLKDNKE